MDYNFFETKVNELKGRQKEILDEKRAIQAETIEKMQASGISSLCLPEKFVELDKEYWEIDEQLWNATSYNKDIVYYQFRIFSLQNSINLIDSELEKYEILTKLNVIIKSENDEWNPIKNLLANKKECKESIKRCKEEIQKIKNNF
ncbi:MAG: hypothetical protein IJ660_05890 [Alphaproteobacteria bacterium]|nr:hypothetical protein [Alphaproteobacteria bacterium]